MKILILDKHESIRELFYDEFSKLGHNVATAYTMKMAGELWNSFYPDIVFCGSHLLDGDGLLFLIEMREKHGYSTPLYIMSSWPIHSEETYLKHGASGFIDKSKNLNDVFSIVTNLQSSAKH